MRKINLPVLALITANIIWGAASPIFKYSLQNIPPFSLAYLRFLLAACLLYIFIHRKIAWNDLKNKYLWLFAFSGVTFNITLFFLALQRTASINAPIIASIGPIFVLFGAAVFLREKITRSEITGTLISAAGVAVIILEPVLNHGVVTEIIGNLLLVGATLGAVGQTLVGRKILNQQNVFQFTFWSFLIGAITFLPMTLLEYSSNPGWIINLDHRGFLGIAFGAVLSSAAAYSLYNWALSKIPANRTGVFTYLDPIVAIIIAVPLLGETITPPFVLGSFLVFAGILLAEKRLPYHPIHKLIVKSEKLI